jgi:hypothetical protein
MVHDPGRDVGKTIVHPPPPPYVGWRIHDTHEKIKIVLFHFFYLRAGYLRAGYLRAAAPF